MGAPDLYLMEVDRGRVAVPSKKTLRYSDLTRDQRNTLIEKTHAQVLQQLRVIRKCRYCDETFADAAELGRLHCQWHPGKVVSGAWTCCGHPLDDLGTMQHPMRPMGCCLADHTDAVWDSLRPNYYRVPVSVARMIGVPQSRVALASAGPTNDRSALRRTCDVSRTTQERTPFARIYVPPRDIGSAPKSDMNRMRERLELNEYDPKQRFRFSLALY